VKTIGLEEHFFTASVVQAWGRLEPQWQNPPGLNARDDLAHRLTDLDRTALRRWKTPGSMFKRFP